MGIIGIMPVVDEPFCCWIKPIETAASANPENAGAVFIHGPDKIIPQTVWIIRLVPVTDKVFRFPIKSIEALRSPNPERTGPVFIDRPNRIGAQALGIIRIVPVMGELLRFVVKLIESVTPSPNPECAGMVGTQRPDGIVTQAVGIIRVVTEHFYTAAIISVQPTPCAKPHESLAVLGNAPYSVIRQPVFSGESAKFEVPAQQ